jgi:hypothetical protein
MYLTGLETGILFVAGASAAVLRSPVQVHNDNKLNLQPSLAGNGNFQRVLGSPPGGAHSTGTPVRDFMNIIYVSSFYDVLSGMVALSFWIASFQTRFPII